MPIQNWRCGQQLFAFVSAKRRPMETWGMKCNICAAEEATVHLVVMAEGRSLEIDLCQACAAEKGANDPTGFSLPDLLSAVKASQRSGQKPEE